MSDSSVNFLEWLNANANRSYPIKEDASMVDISGNFKIPDSLIVDAIINVPRSLSSAVFFISSITLSTQSAAIDISYRLTENTPPVLCGHAVAHNVPLGGGDAEDDYRYCPFVSPAASTGDIISGIITVGPIMDALQNGTGKFDFMYYATPLEIHCIYVSTPAVQSVSIWSGSESLQTFSDKLKIKAGQGMRITVESDQTIRFDVISSATGFVEKNTEELCGTAIENASIRKPIKTINGHPPDGAGNFSIDGGECIDVSTSAGRIALKDSCSQSCCGCKELDVLIKTMENIKTQLTTITKAQASTEAMASGLFSNLISNLS